MNTDERSCSEEFGKDESLILEFPNGPKVDEVTDRLLGDSHVVHDLGFVIGTEVGNRLQFDNNPLKDKQIGNALLIKLFPLVVDGDDD